MQHMGTIQDELEEKLKKANAEHNQQLQVKEEQVQFLKAALDSSKQATAAAGDSLDAAQLENLVCPEKSSYFFLLTLLSASID